MTSPHQWLVRISTFVVAAAAAASCIYWYLKLQPQDSLARRTIVAAQAASIDSNKIAALMGARQESGATAEPAPISKISYKLIGVIAPGAKSPVGTALIALDGQPARPFRVGSEVSPGMLLHSVSARAAMLASTMRGPIVTTIELPAMDRRDGSRSM